MLIIRVVTGLIFFMHGYQKLFDDGYAAIRDSFDSMGVPLPAITALLALIFELVGGVMLFSGIYTRFVAFLLAIEMVIAIIFVHFENGFFVGNNGMEFALLLVAVLTALVIAGAGQYSVDTTFHLPYSEDWKTLAENRRS